MSTSLLRVVERAQQDAEQGPEAIQSNGLRRVSAPPTPTGRGPARSAHETLGRTLQLLRSERQPSKFGPSGSRHATGLAKMAAPSQPAHASHVGAVQPIVGTLPASPAAGCRADMGGVATRHISGGAGWWKSPCPVLVRASGEQSPGATRPPLQWAGPYGLKEGHRLFPQSRNQISIHSSFRCLGGYLGNGFRNPHGHFSKRLAHFAPQRVGGRFGSVLQGGSAVSNGPVSPLTGRAPGATRRGTQAP